jgi:hypothetical protein
VNTDYSNVTVGKVLDTREHEILDIDKLVNELSDIEDLSGLSSNNSTSENSEESQHDNESSAKKKKKTTDTESKAKRSRRRKKQQQDSEDDSDTEEESEEKIIDPNEIRNKMVQHLEQMRLAKQKMKRSNLFFCLFFDIEELFTSERSDKSKRSTTRKRPVTTVLFFY